MIGAWRSLFAFGLALGFGGACSAPPATAPRPPEPAGTPRPLDPAGTPRPLELAGTQPQPPAPAPTPTDAGTAAVEPVPPATLAAARQRAQALFQAQFAAANSGDREGLVATFAADAILLAHTDHPARDTVTAEWLHLAPSMQVIAAPGAKFASGGDDRALWLVAQVALQERGASELHGDAETTTVLRISEVATAAAGWKVVAAAVGVARPPDGYPNIGTMPGKTAPGPLARLVMSPPALLAAMDDDAIALGPDPTDAISVGAAARSEVYVWTRKLLVIDGEVREVRTGDIGFLQAHLASGPSLLVVAIFRGGTPHVVLAHMVSV